MIESKLSDSGNQQPKSRSFEIITKYYDKYFFQTDNLSLIKLLIYTPVGITLVIIRSIILAFILFVQSCCPKLKENLCFIRAICFTLGIHTNNEKIRETGTSSSKAKIYVSNHISCFDYIPIKSVIPSSKYHEDALMNRNLTSKHASHDLISVYFKRLLEFIPPKDTDNLYTKTTEYPFIFFPELIATNGEYGVLKFDQKPFNLNKIMDQNTQEQVEIGIVPIVLKANRPVISFSLNWLGSNDLINIFFLLFTPVTIYNVQMFPEQNLKPGESSEQFADRIQKLIATNLVCSNLDRENMRQMWKDYEKNQQEQQELLEQRREVANRQYYQTQATFQAAEVNRVAAHVKNVLPDASVDMVKVHMIRTSSNDIDTIITSILDSGIDNSPSPVPSPAKQAHKSPVNVKKQPVIGTFQNYETRKKNLINEARERFLSKNQL